MIPPHYRQFSPSLWRMNEINKDERFEDENLSEATRYQVVVVYRSTDSSRAVVFGRKTAEIDSCERKVKSA